MKKPPTVHEWLRSRRDARDTPVSQKTAKDSPFKEQYKEVRKRIKELLKQRS